MVNNKISEKDQKVLLKALDKIHSVQDEQKRKNFEKMFKKISQDSSLEELLNTFTVAELKEVKKIWNVTLASTAKKNDLIKGIITSMEQDISMGMMYFDSGRVNEIAAFISTPIQNNCSMGTKAITYYRKLGILYTGIIDNNKVVVCPNEFKEIFLELKKDKQFTKTISKNDDILNLTRGYLNIYGALSISQCIELIEKSIECSIEYEWFIQFILQRYAYKNNEFIIYGDYICHTDVYDHIDIADKVQQCNYDYKKFSVDKIKEFGSTNYVNNCNSRIAIKDLLLKSYNMEEYDAEEIIDACEYAIKNDKDVQFVMDYLSHSLVVNDMNIYAKLLKHLISFKEETIHWALKGHTPKEIEALSQIGEVKAKIGRNDPCSCGSGKKYKKCCGKN
ncbi:SEC-C metal-binding domain-containing protein [Oceanirhabdus sp. W0125-5]|uniref:SEC-C metal-binding domain-containing protein n=1 Tax=Oceanirhabdus sp. W0125-5 TaxID=2999116 RepID=UPI0022F30972|nr:SEC-C metal-binding domain-containing protein [Oceanirhabdus sp. W0125-5]WBW99323.1 SEC-C metal-binding domain-containing protein [Oceanirhabdus sp. W0125-5]